MLMKPEDFVELVTTNKDTNLGKYLNRDWMAGCFQGDAKRKAEADLTSEQCESMFDAIQKQLEKTETLEYTNVEVHYCIRADSMKQYVTPYNKDYEVGKTKNFIKEDVIWSLRPEHVHIGFVWEKTSLEGASHSLKEEQDHKFGSVDEYFNVIVVHTRELHENKAKPESNTKFSTIHIAVYIPVSDDFFRKISAVWHEREMKRRALEQQREAEKEKTKSTIEKIKHQGKKLRRKIKPKNSWK